MEHICHHEEEIGSMKADISNLIEWQKRQNGSLGRLEDKVNNEVVTKEDLKEVKDDVRTIRNYLVYGFLATIFLQVISKYIGG